jgi:hypothetical protein
MEALNTNLLTIPTVDVGIVDNRLKSTEKVFIEANTIPMSMREIKDEHIIPVYSATNEPLISHHEIIECVYQVTQNWFQNEHVLNPSIRVSHPIKGRVPDAKYKKANELLPWEQTLYFERMMFCIEVPTIVNDINGNKLSLTIGGVKSFSTDNLYGKRPSGEQYIQLFIGFKNHACCNLCISTDGVKMNVGIRSLSDIANAVEQLFYSYNYKAHLEMMQKLSALKISESEFAQFIGKARLYRFLPDNRKSTLIPLLFGDQQMGAVAKDFYTDENFNAESSSGEINLWRLYNLLTGVNKSTYIDQFMYRAINAQELVLEIYKHKLGEICSWYML